ncbi:MAG: three-Cys-motif partner protein TcmP [Flavobacteriaceae bacterium]
MSKKISTIWTADPHTLAKIAILKGYLNAWVPILGRRIRQPLIYVDGFAGPGRYKGGESGSPLVAINAASAGFDKIGMAAKATRMSMYFIEKDKKRYAHLVDELKAMGRLNQKLDVNSPIKSDFETALPRIMQSNPEAFNSDAPVFVFADPFGATGMPFEVLKNAIRGRSSELLINLDADGVRRIYQADNNNREEQLNRLFGCDDWQGFTSCNNDSRKLHREILALYRKQLFKIPGVKYVWEFGMRSKDDSLSYYLVFATKNPLGMEKMKEAMKAISQHGSYSFSDASVDQDHMMFEADDESVYSERMWEYYQEKNAITYQTARDFALNQTPFTNPKSMLATLEKADKLKVRANRKRSAGKFPEDAIDSLEFVTPPPRTPRLEQIGLGI